MLRAQRPLRKSRLRRIAFKMSKGHSWNRRKWTCRIICISNPEDADAIWLNAQIAVRHGRRENAVSLLARCCELDPDFAVARYEHTRLLFGLHQFLPALAQIDWLLTQDPHNVLYLQLKAALLEAIGEEGQSLGIRQILAGQIPNAKIAGYALAMHCASTGHQEETIAAYRRAIASRENCGQAWWSLANMKTVRFADADVSTMHRLLEGGALDPEDRINLFFALGKAYEDQNAFGRSFEFYAKGNAARRIRLDYDWNDINAELKIQRSSLHTRVPRRPCRRGMQGERSNFHSGLDRAPVQRLSNKFFQAIPPSKGRQSCPMSRTVSGG